MMTVIPSKSLPVGYRFRPTDVELIDHYLRLKITGPDKQEVSIIREVDICKVEPWDLPDMSLIESYDDEWFFFCPKDRKYQNGERMNRATAKGFWKATGRDRNITNRKGTKIGIKKTLVFHTGRVPDGKRSNWVIHEYRATDKDLDGTHPGQGAFVLCRLFKKHDLKQDKNAECSNCNEAEPNVHSPTTAKSPVEEGNSEALTPALGVQAEKKPSNAESFPATTSDRATVVNHSPIDCRNDSWIYDELKDHVLDPKCIPLDPDLVASLKDILDDPVPEELDWKISSPLHSQVQYESGSSNLCNPVASDINNNDFDMNEFLTSVLVSSDEYFYEDSAFSRNVISAVEGGTPRDINPMNGAFVRDSGSCCESEAEVTQGQIDAGFFEGELFLANIEQEDLVQQDVALQMATIEQDTCRTDFSSDNQEKKLNLVEKSIIGPDMYPGVFNVNLVPNSLKDNLQHSSVTGGDSASGDGVIIRTRPVQNSSSDPKFTARGTAPRRFRLQKKLQIGPVRCSRVREPVCSEDQCDGQSAVTEDERASKEDTDAAHIDETQDVLVKISTKKGVEMPVVVREPRGDLLLTRVKNIICFPSNGEALHAVPSTGYMPKLFVIVSLLVVFISFWRFYGGQIIG
ncbi:hypothetical protein ACH5RR_017319 [Cinchona calisaya]|uniref:NAC domain-containing protein n=1 Tax=Cinchona calisaya TaxID=153742 RepID=A0ABD3A1P2_9GENT